MAEAHFGGGIFTKKNADQEGDEEKPKTRKEIMDEIILKSKKAKVELRSNLLQCRNTCGFLCQTSTNQLGSSHYL